MKSRAFLVMAAAAALLLALGWWALREQGATPARTESGALPTAGGAKPADASGKRRGPGGPDADRPQPVRAATLARGDLDVTLEALGTITARNTVTVRSRVDGALLRIAFREGQAVRAGDLLAEIDPRPFQVQLEQAQGQLARDEALLANARLDLDRYRGLLAKDSIARQQVDAQEALVRQYEGAVRTDRGALDHARLQLEFSRITAPISGRLGLRQIDAGNMVRAADANGIVMITETRPITAVFSIPSQRLPEVAVQLARMSGKGTALRVEAWDREGRMRLASGRLLAVDNQVDTSSGTVRLKAEFANDDDALFPNQFVNIRLFIETRRGVLLAPAAAVQRGAQGPFAWRVADGAVSPSPVTLGPSQGERVQVLTGLSAGDVVVTDGVDRLKPGGRVDVIRTE